MIKCLNVYQCRLGSLPQLSPHIQPGFLACLPRVCRPNKVADLSFFMRKSTAGHINHLSGNNLILTFFGGDWKAATWKKGKKGDKDVTSSDSVKDKLTDRVCLSSILIK